MAAEKAPKPNRRQSLKTRSSNAVNAWNDLVYYFIIIYRRVG